MNHLGLKNKKIGWIEISSKRYGGVIHRRYMREALSKEFDLELINLEAKHFKRFRYLKIPESFVYLLRLKGEKDLWVRNFFATITMPFDRTKGKNLVLVHHHDFSGFPLIAKPFLNFMNKAFFFRNLKKADAIAVISDYWKDYFLKKGYSNVYRVFNGFDLSKYNISDEEVIEFKKKYKIEGKPIIYLGNCQRGKGVVDSCQALRDIDAHLITSGKRHVRIPALNLDLSYRDYLKLLKASLIVLTMSKFKEGWCRTAHEAMLLKTPVIGSGSGGMEELLRGGRQIVCKDSNLLKEKVEYLLNHDEIRKKIGQSGFDYAKDFTLARLEKSWLDLMNKVLC